MLNIPKFGDFGLRCLSGVFLFCWYIRADLKSYSSPDLLRFLNSAYNDG